MSVKCVVVRGQDSSTPFHKQTSAEQRSGGMAREGSFSKDRLKAQCHSGLPPWGGTTRPCQRLLCALCLEVSLQRHFLLR